MFKYYKIIFNLNSQIAKVWILRRYGNDKQSILKLHLAVLNILWYFKWNKENKVILAA